MEISKNMTNNQIAELLRAVAASYQLKDEGKRSLASPAGKNKFRIISYQRAADAVEHASSELKDLWDEGKLDEVPSIGESIAKHLDEIFQTGKSKHFEKVMKGLPPPMFGLMEIPGIGAKYQLSSGYAVWSTTQRRIYHQPFVMRFERKSLLLEISECFEIRHKSKTVRLFAILSAFPSLSLFSLSLVFWSLLL